MLLDIELVAGLDCVIRWCNWSLTVY